MLPSVRAVPHVHVLSSSRRWPAARGVVLLAEDPEAGDLPVKTPRKVAEAAIAADNARDDDDVEEVGWLADLIARARAEGYVAGLRVGKFGGSETPGLAELGVTEDVYMAVVREENESHG